MDHVIHVTYDQVELGPTGLRARGRNWGQLENRSHEVPKLDISISKNPYLLSI